MTKENNDQKMLDVIFSDLPPKELSNDPNRKILALELEKRKICADEFCRIIPNAKPDFIGNFYSRGNPYVLISRGIFEMFIEKDGNNFSGTIEDCLGTATVKGEILPNKVTFTKNYIEEKSIGGLKGYIKYEGNLIQNTRGKNYEGEWVSSDGKTKGYFDLDEAIF
ncbi:MAG: hypothetical protein PHP97_04280 [Candidatus Shapirobacteria bacterium]|nr:hypothetical protein [Candidatus Shapirobacteria bacterium]